MDRTPHRVVLLTALLVSVTLSACSLDDGGDQRVDAQAEPTVETTTLPPTTRERIATTVPAMVMVASRVRLETPDSARDVDRILARLQVADEVEPPGYDRELFPHWSAQGEGCDTRERVLLDEAIGNVQTDIGCTIVAGDWRSYYDGEEIDDPSELDIDHVVALHEAWQSGAAEWDAATREAFANDLDYRGSLVAVTASSNRSKSDRDPAEWRPPEREAWCAFSKIWVTVKIRWGLAADEDEIESLRDLLETCY